MVSRSKSEGVGRVKWRFRKSQWRALYWGCQKETGPLRHEQICLPGGRQGHLSTGSYILLCNLQIVFRVSSLLFLWAILELCWGLGEKPEEKQMPKGYLECGVGEDSWESLGLQGDPASPSYRRLALGVHWKDWCWSWISSTLATWWEEVTHWKRPWCWEGLRAGGEGDDRGWDGWMASLTRWAWVWVNTERWWWTGRPGMLRFMGSQRVRHDWATELNGTEPLY